MNKYYPALKPPRSPNWGPFQNSYHLVEHVDAREGVYFNDYCHPLNTEQEEHYAVVEVPDNLGEFYNV